MTHDTDNISMAETMREIDKSDDETSTDTVSHNKRENLEADISSIEKNIVAAQAVIDEDHEENTYTPVSPEKANENKRNVVFLRKELESKKSEIKHLDE